jgi:surface polysaccharide O-acyltransferase-like enzyme
MMNNPSPFTHRDYFYCGVMIIGGLILLAVYFKYS